MNLAACRARAAIFSANVGQQGLRSQGSGILDIK